MKSTTLKDTMLLVLCTFALLPTANVYAQQQGKAKVSGIISDTKGKTLSGVSILVKTGSETFGNVSNEDGVYEVTFTKVDTVSVTFSHVGYNSFSFVAGGTKDIKRNVTLARNGIMLSGVTVEAPSVIIGDHVTYIPTKQQVNGANSGIGLLFNLMIPQIDVNPVTGEIKTSDNSSFALSIDGRQASVQEINRLRPKDVERVELHENPQGMFATVDKVVNYVTKKYESGGYVDVRTNTHLLYPNGEYTAQASFDRKNVNLLAIIGTGFDNDNLSGSRTTELFNLNPAFTKYSYTNASDVKKRFDVGLLQLSVRGKRSMFMAQGLIRWNETPKNLTGMQVEYSNNVHPMTNALNNVYSKNLSPSINLYHQIQINNKQQIVWNAKYDYARNSYRRNYIETTTPITSDVTENYNTLNATINYNLAFNNNQLSLLLWNVYNASNADYRGTVQSNQDLSTYDLLFYPTYTHKFGKALTVSLQLGFDLNTYKVNEEKRVTKIWPRPRINANMMLGKSSYATFMWGLGTVTPQLSMLNSAEQYVSEYMIMRGNPNLGTGKVMNGYMSYNKGWKNVNLSAYLYYNGVLDIGNNYYLTENNKIIQTFMTNGNYHHYQLGINCMFNLLKRNLQLKLTAAFDNFNQTGIYHENLHEPVFTADLYYNIGKFSLAAYYKTPRKRLHDTPIYDKEKCNYGLTASWGHRGWFVQVGCQRIFDNHGYGRSYYDYGCYKLNQAIFNNNTGHIAYINLSYSFDFGRKVERQNINLNQGNGSGILHP